MYDDILDNLKFYFPMFYDRAINIHRRGKNELIIELVDGRIISYYDVDHTFRFLPELDSISEERYRREFGIRLRQIMEEKWKNQTELSEMTGIPQSVISLYINGKRTPSFYTVNKIAKALKCSTDDFRFYISDK